jgi:hypothetical protein
VQTAANLAPNPAVEAGGEEPAAWRFQNWSGGKRVEARRLASGGRNAGGCLTITVPAEEDGSRSYRNLDAAVYDWSIYWYETAADYINRMARLVKKHDPARPCVTYLTFSFAYPAEWDYTQNYGIAPDEVAMRGDDIDQFGMQICAADGDPYRVTACLDLVRKYGKPMWAVDLVDFTSGVHIGYEAMDRVTQSAIQHGAKGIIYCAWHIPSVLDYSYHPLMTPPDIQQMLTDARSAVKTIDGLEVAPRAALVEPILPASPKDPEGFKNDYRSFLGWYKLLESLRETFDVVTLREIALGSAKLDRYEYVLLPDCAFLPEAALSELEQYTRRGGRLLTAGRFAQYNEIRIPLSPQSIDRTVLPDYGKTYAGDPVRDTHAGNTPPLLLWREDTPATHSAFREGRAALQSFIRTAGLAPNFELLPDDPEIRCVEYRGKNITAVYLVNMAREPVPAGKLKLQIPYPAKTLEVYADTRLVPAGIDEGVVVLPAFRSSLIVKAALGPQAGADQPDDRSLPVRGRGADVRTR